MKLGTMPYQYSVTSFTSREVLNILNNPDWSRVIREAPARPRAGEVFLFHYTDDCKKDDWRCDQYHFQHDGLRKQPRTNPKFYKNFFVLRTSRGKDKRFKKHAYVLLENHNKLVLFQYLGDESVAVDLPHGNSKDTSKSYTRICPSVIQALKDTSIKPRDIHQQLQDQAQAFAVPGIMIPRSLSQISNTRCREKRIHQKVKKKTRKKKRACRQTKHKVPTDLAQDHLVPASHCTEDDIPQTTDTAGVMSPQTPLNKLAELCETIYQENMTGVPNMRDSCDNRINASVVENHSHNAVQSVQSNADRMYPSSSQETSPVTATSSALVTGYDVNLNMSSHGTVLEMGPPQTICLIIQDAGVSSAGVQVTDSVVTLDNSAETVPNLDREGYATSSHSDTLQPHNVTSVTQTAPSALECFFESQNNTGQLPGVITLMKETLKTEVEREFKESVSQTLPVRCIGEFASKDNPPLPETAVSLVAQVSRLWTGDFRGAQQLLLKSHFPGQDIQNDVPLLEVLAAVVVGAFEAKLDCLAFLETLKIYPHHLQRARSEQRTIDFDPVASYRIGTYTVSGSDILGLEGTSWLDDSVIHAYLCLVQKDHTDARSQAVWIMECFQYKLWEKHNYSQWLYEKTEFKKYDLLLMPICVNSHWVLLSANIRDRTVCVINSRPSKDLETEVSQHWMQYMACRSRVVEEELRSWSLVQCPVFPQTDGSSCGVFVLMAAEALAAGVPPCLMRNCHVAAYRQYVKQRLMSAGEMTHMVLAVDEQAETVMSMESAQAQIKETDVSVSEPTPDVANNELTPGVSGSELTPDVSGDRPTPMDCEMIETENVKFSEETTCALLSKEESSGSSIDELRHVPSDAIAHDNTETTRDRNFGVKSSTPCDCSGTDEEDMKVEATEESVQGQSGPMESGPCEHTLDHVSTRSQCEALFESQKPNFTALMLLCLEKGKLMMSNLDDAAEEFPLQGHMKWSCQLTRMDEMSKEQFSQCLHGLSGSLLTSQDSVVQFRYKETQSHIEEIIKAAAVEYICELDPLFIYRHVKVSWTSLKNDPGFIIYLDKSRQKDLALHFATEIEKHNFAFTLSHQACGKHTFASTLVRSIGIVTSVYRNIGELFKTCDKTHGGTFLNWICFGRNAELYKVLSSYMTEEEKKECVIPCCVSGNSEILQLLLEDMELDVILSISPSLQVVYGIYNCKGQTECLQTHHLPPLHLASYYGHADIVQLLLQYGCDVNAQLEPQLDESGQVSSRSTAAAVAAHRGHTEVLKCLMESKADLNLVDCNLNTPLHLACEAGHERSVLILASMCEISSRNKDGNTPVHLACQEGRIDFVDILLKRNADLTILNFDNSSPLHVVCSKGYSDVLQLLLERIAYPLPVDGSQTPLHVACQNGHSEIVRTLLQHGAGRSVSGARATPLSWACENGHTDIVKLLIEKGADVSAADDGDTPLSWACKKGHIDIVKLLIEKGADVSAAVDYGDTPLTCACKKGYIDIVKLLIEKGADVSAAVDYGDTPLTCACKKGYIDIVKLLIEKGADVSAAVDYGDTPLLSACENGHIDIVKLLIEKGADVSAAAGYGDTPLSLACENDHIDIVKLLIEKGADVSADDDYGDTPLSWAYKKGHIDIVKLLMEKGADVSAAVDYGDTPLSWACKKGYIDIVKLLIEKGADVSAADGAGDTPLSWACKKGYIDIVKLLIEKGADVSAADDGDTPLSWACKKGHIDIVKLLIEKGADVSAAVDYGDTPLTCACKKGYIDIVKLLIEKGADVSAAVDYGDTPLLSACENGHIDIVKLLIEKGADVSAAAGYGDTPLSLACENDHIDIVKLLIEKGADVSAAAGYGDTPLSLACENDHIDIVKLLIEKGADVSAAGYGVTPLSWACRTGHIDIVKLLIEKGADVSAAGYGVTPLSWACRTGHIDIVKLLIEKGADVSADDDYGDTPLSWAYKKGHIDIVKLLMEKGADVSAAVDYGDTPLSWACKKGYIDIVKLLIEKGADVSAADGAGDTPLSWACRTGHSDIVKLLIEKGADVSADDDDVDTPLSWACKKGHIDIVKLLIEKGADVSAAVEYGDTPLSWACKKGYIDIVKLLVGKGANVSAAAGNGDTPLSWACKKGHIDIVKLLIEKRADVSAAVDYGDTLLSWACKKGHIDIVKLLIEKGADVSAAGYTPLLWACENGNIDIVKLLIEKGADVSAAGYGVTPLSLACRTGHIDIVKLLIEKGAEVSAADNGDTPLLLACKNDHIDIVKLLIEKGADVSAAGYTLLLCACENGNIDIVKLLIEKGADVSAADDGDTPLLSACRNGHIDIVKLLIEKGADVSAAGYSTTPLSLACRTGHSYIVKLLIEKGADVSAAVDYVDTPLSWACKKGHIDIVKLLIEKGADVSAAGYGTTPLSLACKNGHVDIVKLLIEKGADVPAADGAGDTPVVRLLGYNMNISAGRFAKGEREVVSLLLKELLPKHVTSLSDYCHRSLIDSVFISESLDIVKNVCGKSDQKSFSDRLCQSLLEKAVVKGDAYGVWLLTEYATPMVSNDLLLRLMSKAIDNRHIAVFQMLHCIPHVHDSCDTLVQKACSYGLVQVCNILLRCGSNHSGICLTKALEVKNVVLAELLLSHGVDVNARDDDDNTSLHLACEVGECSLVKVIAKSVGVSQTNKRLETPLFVACRYGYATVANLLLSLGANMTTKDVNGNTPLFVACRYGYANIANLLLSLGANMTTKDVNGNTPLFVACRYGHASVAKLLLSLGADITTKDVNGNTVLHSVCQSGQEKLLQLFIHYIWMETGSGYHDQAQEHFCNRRYTDDVLHILNNDGETPLHVACRKKRTGVVKLLLQYKASVFMTDKNGHTPLYHAMKLKTLFSVLCSVTRDINGMDSDGNTILHLACMKGCLENVDVLCRRGASVVAFNKNNDYALHKSAENGNAEIMNILLSHQADVNVTDRDKQTPLHIACAEGNVKIVELLIKSKVNVNVPDKHLHVPLHLACRDGHRDIADALMKTSADIEPFSRKRYTPLIYACEAGHIDCVALLLENGACVNVAGFRGNTPLHRASVGGHVNVVRLLLSCGADPIRENDNGKLPLHHAVLWGHLAIVNMLLDRTRSFLQEMENMMSLLERACSRGHVEIVKRLIDFIPGSSMSSLPMTSLVASVIHANHIKLLPVLADKGLNIKLQDEFGRNALTMLCETEDCEIDTLEKVLELGFDLSKTTGLGESMLHVVCKVGNIELVNYLIGRGIDIQTKDTNGDTALHAACAHGHFEIAKVLIEKGLSFNEKNAKAMSPLDLAIINTHYEVTCVYDLWCAVSKCRPRISMMSLHHICRDNKIQLLYNSEIVFAEKDSDGNSALHIACEEVSEEIVQLLIIAGAWLLVFNKHGETPVHIACHGPWSCLKAMMDAIQKVKDKVKVLSLCDKNGNAPLHHVTCEQNVGNLCILLDNNVDVEMVNSFHQTALHIACYGGNATIVEKLLGAGASVLAVDKSGNTPLHIVCKEGNLPLLKLINNTDDVITSKNYEGRTPFHEAVSHGHYDMIHYMITEYCHFSAMDLSVLHLQQFIRQMGKEDFVRLMMAEDIDTGSHGNTPLHYAAETESLAMVRSLIRRGYSCDARNKQGKTPLFNACSSGSANIVKLIMQESSSSTVSDSNNMAPLHVASWKGHVDVVNLLLESDHDLQAKTNEGQTALHLSCLAGHRDVAEVLLKAGSDMNALDSVLDTPLHLAARAGVCDVVVLQAKWGARDTQCNTHGDTALHVACDEGHADAVKALLNMGSDILATNNLEKTPLMLACDQHHESIVELLLHRSWLQIQVQCSQNQNQGFLRKKTFINNLNYCLLVACTYSYINTVKLLLKYDVDINHRSSESDIGSICRDRTEGGCASDIDKMEGGCTSHKDRVQMDSGAELETPLHSCCYEGHSECVELLIQAGALLEPRTARGDTPLHVACKQGQARIVDLLIAKGVSLSPVNSDNCTPLHYACEGGYEGLVSRLLEAGADADVRDVHGKSPLEVCSSRGVKNILHKRCGRKRNQESSQETEATPIKVPRQQ